MSVMARCTYADDGTVSGYHFWCPACAMWHEYNLDSQRGPVWDFDDDEDRPTFSPSLRVRIPRGETTDTCHLFVRNGQIQYCGDCTHDMAGQTVTMVPLDCPDCGETVDVYADDGPNCDGCEWKYQEAT